MRKFVTVLTLFFMVFTLRAEVIVLTGVYQGKDLYVKNPMTSDGIGYCVFEVLVNGQVTSDEVNSPAFAVDLRAWKLKVGDPLEVILRCKEDCAVKVINPEVIYPNSTFEITAVNLDSHGLLTWTTEKETAPIPFNIEQYKWNKWVKVGEVAGLGNEQTNSYKFQATLTSGTNLFRIQQVDHKGAHFSEELRVQSSTPEVKIESLKVTKSIDFSSETDFEVYSEFGELVRAGRAKSVDISKFFKGNYYVNFDNKTGTMVVKK
jgi:hypothetical protein